MAPVLVSFLLFFFSFHLLPLSANSDCLPSFPCGYVSLEFPFTVASSPGCGLITVDGCDLDPPFPTINLGSGIRGYNMLGKDSTNEISVIDIQLEAQLRNRSCYSFTNLSMIQSPSISFSFTPNLTFFSCNLEFANKSMLEKRFENYSKIDCLSTFYYRIPTTNDSAFEENDVPHGCSLVQLPMKTSSRDSDDLFGVLSANFTLEWNVSQHCLSCFHGGGLCLTDNENQFYCKKENWRLKKILFIVGMTIASLASTLIFIIVFIRRKRAKERSESDRDIELFLKNNGNLAPIRYKYSSIKKITNLFGENLGRGGFGSVYKGQLLDGHPVAVKVLNESNGNGEDFMNEVSSISRTSHINIVTLVGFCFEGSKRALIYDFMPNGSLEKFIGNTVESGLGWDNLFEIALGIARGLEYLHQGCNTRILHLDIKPQNILLDKDLNPRISDFGLAKLCPNRSSIVSMMVARGTIGYIAPEVFSRNFGDVSYKSDVYSYGMLVLEMVGGRRTVDRREVDRTSEIYFPHYIYKQLEEDADRDFDLVGTVDEDETQVVKRNLMIIGLWCIQTNPKDRPSMTKVVEMLEGKLGSLEVPPKPYLYSPPRSIPTFSSSESF